MISDSITVDLRHGGMHSHRSIQRVISSDSPRRGITSAHIEVKIHERAFGQSRIHRKTGAAIKCGVQVLRGFATTRVKKSCKSPGPPGSRFKARSMSRVVRAVFRRNSIASPRLGNHGASGFTNRRQSRRSNAACRRRRRRSRLSSRASVFNRSSSATRNATAEACFRGDFIVCSRGAIHQTTWEIVRDGSIPTFLER